MEETNKQTLDAYESGVQQYIQHTPNSRGAVVEHWINVSLEGVHKESKILEIGSAFGRDASYIESRGYHVDKTDATSSFVDILKEKDPSSRLLNIVTDEIDDTYDLVIANAVLLHMNNDETKLVIDKVHRALNAGGTFVRLPI